jgi:hypothetical protein
MVFGEEWGNTKTTAAKHLSPASGVITAHKDFVSNLLEGNFLQVLLGPSSNTMPSLKRTAEYLSDLWSLRDVYTTPELLTNGLIRLTENFGTFSSGYKAYAMLQYKQKLGEFYSVDKNGRPTVQYQHASEVWSKGLFNIGYRGEEELYNDVMELNKKFNGSSKEQKGIIKDEATHLVKYFYQEYAKSTDPMELAEKMNAISFALNGTAWGEMIKKEAISMFKLDPKFPEFAQKLIKQEMLFNPDASVEKYKNMVRNSRLISPEEKEIMIMGIDAEYKAIQTANELLKSEDL